MPDCKKIDGRHRKICIGSMNRLVSLRQRDITEPAQDLVDYTENFTEIAQVWADVKTTSRGEVVFDRTNTARQVTHIFSIRYRSDVTAETWITLDDINYDILDTEDLEEKNEFMFLKAVKKGDKTLPVNQV